MIEETGTNFRLTALGRRRLELGNGTAKGGLRETSEIDLWYRRSVDIGDFYVVEALSAEALHRSHGLSSRPAFDDNSGAVAGVFRLDKHNCHSTITKPAFGLPM